MLVTMHHKGRRNGHTENESQYELAHKEACGKAIVALLSACVTVLATRDVTSHFRAYFERLGLETLLSTWQSLCVLSLDHHLRASHLLNGLRWWRGREREPSSNVNQNIPAKLSPLDVTSLMHPTI